MTQTFQVRTRIVHGDGEVDQLGQHVRDHGASKVLVVSDPGIVASGHVARAEASLRSAGIEVAVFDAVHENPTTEDVAACADAVRTFGPDLLVGLGGGSSIDAAKGANFVVSGGGELRDYQGWAKVQAPMLPMIAVPTTAGTGSEVQSFALISDAATHAKMACGDPKAAPKLALLDPTLTVSMPTSVTCCTGMDTITHAVETAVTRTRSPFSSMLAREAFALAARSLPRILDVPGDLAARGSMMQAASLAGLAIENSMLGAAHAMANPLTAHHGTAHGQAVGMFLPHVVRFNALEPDVALEYARLSVAAGWSGSDATPSEAVAELVRGLERLLRGMQFPAGLAELGVSEPELTDLAREADGQWTARHNPRRIDEASLLELYRGAYEPSA